MNDSESKEAMEQQENELNVNILSKEVANDNPGRPGRRTSRVWQVFNRLNDNNAECTLCNRVLSFKSSVTNLAKHIQRKHASSFINLCGEEDPREGLKEFITIDTGHSESVLDEDGEEDPIRSDDAEWVPPSKSARKSASSAQKKVIKKEVISSNGVDYVIYTQDQVPARPTPSLATKSTVKRTSAVSNQRSITGRSPIITSVTGAPILSSPPRKPQVEEDEFSTFAKFLSQRIRALKNPYWQSCAINEINSALHRIEMRRYEIPKVDCAQRFAQTDPVDPLEAGSGSIAEHTPVHESHHVVEVISQEEDML